MCTARTAQRQPVGGWDIHQVFLPKLPIHMPPLCTTLYATQRGQFLSFEFLHQKSYGVILYR